MKNLPRPIVSVICLGALSAVAVFTTGCASIVHGGSRNITINSRPSGAKVTIAKTDSGQLVHSGTTPLTVMLDPRRGYFKGQSYTVRFELPGYNNAEIAIRPEMSGWYWGNILFGGLIGMIVVDPITGSMWNLSPDRIEHPLSAEQADMIRQGKGFVVVLVQDLSARERAELVRIN